MYNTSGGGQVRAILSAISVRKAGGKRIGWKKVTKITEKGFGVKGSAEEGIETDVGLTPIPSPVPSFPQLNSKP